MSAVGRIAALIFSRQTLALLGIALLGAALWFGGPHLAFGESKPLEPVGTRLIVLLLLLAFLLFWMLHWPVSMVGAAALCFLLWRFGPAIAVGEARPLEPEWARLLAVGLIVLLYSAYLLYRLWQAVRANDDLLQKILHPRFGRADAADKERVREVEGVFKEGLARLRSLRVGLGLVSGLFQRKRYIYDLPWYVIIGAPGSGKTTAILNSGLNFPLSGQGGIPGGGGTRNCTWWFSNEAVLLDTAGRYATHETDAEQDQAEWRGFLKLLRVHRTKAPINGALVVVSAEELVNKSAEELARHAECLRARLEEIRTELGIVFPVYVLVTKMDFIRGFKEYFKDLTADGRAGIWGFTMPLNSGQDLNRQCAVEIEGMAHRLDGALPRRLHEEIDPARRRRIYCLPSEMRAMGRPLLQLLERLFPESRYGETLRNMLRGVYFTSALQSDHTVNADANTIFRRFMNLASASLPPALRPGGETGAKSYFLRNLLQKVVFAESFLVRPNAGWEIRWRAMRLTGHLCVILAAAALGHALLNSHEANVALLAEAQTRLASAGEQLALIEREKREELTASALLDACGPMSPQGEKESPPLAWRLGLYSGEQSDAYRAMVCRNLQDRLIVPRITDSIAGALAAGLSATAQNGRPAASGQDRKADASGPGRKADAAAQGGKGIGGPDNDQARLYSTLRAYLRLFSPERHDAGEVLRWFADDMRRGADKNFFAASRSLYAELERCLTRPGGLGLPPNAADGRLIAAVRARLDSMPQKERIYERAKAHMAKDAPEDFSVSRAAGAEGGRLFYRKSGRPLERCMPGLFTREGYHGLFNARLNKYVSQALEEDSWVMGVPAAAGGARALAADPAREIRRLYLREYADRWEELLADIHPVTGASLPSLISSIQALAAPGSPLPLLARAAARETTLSSGAEQAAADKLAALAAAKGGTAGKSAAAFRPESAREMEMVDMRFAPLREAVYGSGDPRAVGGEKEQEAPGPGLEAVMNSLRELAAHLREAQAARDAGSAPPPGGPAQALQAEADRLPQFLKNVLNDFMHEGTSKVAAARGDTLGQLAGNSVGEMCRGAVTGYYPFNRKGQDMDPARFARFFGPGGVMDAFFQKNLAPYVDTESKPWRYRQPMPGAPDLRPFEQAAAIREAFFSAEEGKGGVKFQITPVEMDSRINRLSIKADGREWNYEHGPALPLAFSVPAESGKGGVEISITPRPRGTADVKAAGAFAGMRVLEMGKVESTGDPRRFYVHYHWEERDVSLEVSAPEHNPLLSDLFSSFTCPEALRDPGARVLR